MAKTVEQHNADVALAHVVQAARAYARSQNPATDRDLLVAVAAYDVALRALAGDWRPLLEAITVEPTLHCVHCDEEIPPGTGECPACGPVKECTACAKPHTADGDLCFDCGSFISFGGPSLAPINGPGGCHVCDDQGCNRCCGPQLGRST